MLESLLMVGYPRALIASTVWRKVERLPAPDPDADQDYSRAPEWARRGEELCAVVYGENYASSGTAFSAASGGGCLDGHRGLWPHPGASRLRSQAAELCTVAQTAVLEPLASSTPPSWCAERRRHLWPNRRSAIDREPAALVRPVEKGQGALENGAQRLGSGRLMLIDRAVVRVVGGTGGSGASSFARFKYKPKGGPDGGDGGHGGSVYVKGDPNLATLLDYRYRTTWKAERGEHGKGKTQTGASSADIYLPVPPGTVIRDA